MKVNRHCLPILFLCVSACVENKSGNSDSNTSFQNTPEGAAVEKVLKAYYEDMSKRDWQRYRSHFQDNATITTAWQKPGDSLARVDVNTIDEFIRKVPDGPDSQPVFEEKMTSSRIQTEGNIAVAWVEYEAKFGKPDSLVSWTGTDVFTMLRHDGEFKIVSLVFESK